MPLKLLLAGASTRAAAESAARAGCAVTAVDAYADLDQHPSVSAMVAAARNAAGVDAADLARTAIALDADAVAYLSPFENHPAAVRALARGRRLLGNSVDVLRRVRDPLAVYRAFRDRGIDAPRVIVAGDRRGPGVPADAVGSARADASYVGFMLKPRKSGGGHGIARADATTVLQRGWYLQELVEGWPGSVTFVAAGRQCAVLAVSRQIVGDAAFGASDYRYCGSLIDAVGDGQVRDSARALAAAAVEAFDLVGVNGIDFIARDGVAVPVEINPRWSSSMELVDRWGTTPVMASHVDACHGSLTPVPARRGRPTVIGKAVVFARGDVVMPDTSGWLADPTVRDVPRPGQSIRRGQPVCTVFADGSTLQACHAALVSRAADVYTAIDSARR